jgi:hypothetical protein
MTYKEFPEIEIPAFLQSPEWADNSWHNDTHAHSDLALPGGKRLEVWVNFEKPEEREFPGVARYMVVLADDDLEGDCLLETEDAAEVQRMIAKVKADVFNAKPTRMTEEQIKDLARAALDAAALHIQNALGVKSGDVASVVFSDDKVEELLAQYIRTELRFNEDDTEVSRG